MTEAEACAGSMPGGAAIQLYKNNTDNMGPELLNKYVGVTELNMRLLFQRAGRTLARRV
jgi:SpoVK/Ycf46/Vps4 family AAA+-type ATPase